MQRRNFLISVLKIVNEILNVNIEENLFKSTFTRCRMNHTTALHGLSTFHYQNIGSNCFLVQLK